MDDEWAPSTIDTTKPSVARVYDFMLGGKDNFASDRNVAEMALGIAPDAPEAARASRAFLRRVVRYLAASAGVHQFIDLGSGLPTQGNVHEIAQRVDPRARVVYVDNDPIVLAHGRAILSQPDTTAVIEADIGDPDAVLESAKVRRLIDFDEPVGLLMFSILHHLADAERPSELTARYRDRLPSGSHLAIAHFHNPGSQYPEVAEQAAS